MTVVLPSNQGRVKFFTDSSSGQGKMVCELSSVTWSVVAGSCRAVCRHACLPIGPLELEPLCAPLPNQATQYAEQPPWRPQCSAPSYWPPLKLWSRAGLSCAQWAGARCQMGWMAEIVMQRRTSRPGPGTTGKYLSISSTTDPHTLYILLMAFLIASNSCRDISNIEFRINLLHI